ncbi:GIY-YIG nuclease family protein [Allobranchiibius sp. GilTou38]|uniref:GIY-YIG nuclease family protein n=1 Tax=Allobranchiibius sp. GilTou38 TaxID=2815210 RepID=UPI001AA1709A|nr:GIY-YIG nuclease family protein [Allobranchiibius sp. GilTou38]MBO1765448.1 GIY-YIG nuclease family protein [Allobranchiibius sp. GilTou38]
MEAIPLTSVLPEGFDSKLHKIHFAVWNQIKHPVDVLATNDEEWHKWNSWRSVHDDFNRKFIFSMAQDKTDATLWLFGGIWEVLARRPEPQAHSYTVALREDLMGPFIRRLWVRHRRVGRNSRQKMESVLPAMTVSSILKEPFIGDPFPGHDRINHSLADLQAVVSQARADWRIALESMKGVYVIHDKETGQRYVGSAYGDTGIWQRWATYATTLHGGNVGLKELLEQKGSENYRANMRFALLEYWSMRTDDEHVLERESYWKDVLHARSLGLNKN